MSGPARARPFALALALALLSGVLPGCTAAGFCCGRLTDFDGRTSADILDCVRTGVIIIPSQVRASPVVRIELDCDWEPEHGLEWVVESPNFIVYVGPFRMIDDWRETHVTPWGSEQSFQWCVFEKL